MELVQYVRLFRRWLWLILLAAFVGGAVSFIVKVNQAPLYKSQATVIVGSALGSPNPNSTEIRTGIDLAITYAQIVHTYDILDAVVVSLELPFSVELLDEMIDTNIISGTSLLEISVLNTDRILAAEIANEIVIQLISQSPSNLTVDQRANIDLLQGEIDSQTEELTSLRTDLRAVNQEIGNAAVTDEEFTDLDARRTILTNQINDASANIAQNLNTIASLTQRTNSVEIIESARIPIEPVGSTLIQNIALGTLASISLAFSGILIYEYFNDTLRNADEVSRTLNLPVLGVIANFGKKDMSYEDRLLINLQDSSQISEEYRALRTNILYSSQEAEKTFVISSSSPQEGKSVTAANLAVSMAVSGLRVLLIDADLRRPKIHESFGLPNTIGLANLLSGRIAATSTSKDETGKDDSDPLTRDSWKQFLQKTAVPNLAVITSGFVPHNPSELLGSALMKFWMKEFREAPIDVVIFDTPPALTVSDSTILAATLNTKVILVVQANRTRRDLIIKTKERFTTVNADIIGVVLNNADLREENYYGYDYSYYNSP